MSRPKLMVAVDFGEATDALLIHAFMLGKDLRWDIEILHVYPLDLKSNYSPSDAAKQRIALEDLQSYAMECRERTGISVDLNFRVTNHSVAEVIADASGSADLLLVGQTVNKGAWRFLSTDVTQALIGRVECPVLVVPSETDFVIPKHITLAIDDYPLPRKSLLALERLVKTYSSKLDIVHQDDNRGSRPGAQLDEALAEIPFDYHYATSASSIPKFIENAIAEHTADWVSVVHHHRPEWQEALRKDVSERVADKSTLPVLVLTGPARSKETNAVGLDNNHEPVIDPIPIFPPVVL